MDLIPILLGSLPLAHNAQHSLVISNSNNYGTRPGYGTVRGTLPLFFSTIILRCIYHTEVLHFSAFHTCFVLCTSFV